MGDINKALAPIFEKDFEGTKKFVSDYMEVSELKDPGEYCKHVERTLIYLGFRFGGLGYGPKFRAQRQSFARRVPNLEGPVQAMAALMIGSVGEEWEEELKLHPGVMDCTLQAGAAMG